jgi:hypothetical protein
MALLEEFKRVLEAEHMPLKQYMIPLRDID